jgi:formylglycine-generating enzyme required for sulfatase activity
VPGNHDADRRQVDLIARMAQQGLLAAADQDEIATVLADPGQGAVLFKRHAAYLAFYGAWLGTAQTLPWWQRTIEIRGQRLHLAGLDSAWMACDDQDYGRLLLSHYQINQTVDVRAAAGADWRIALLHHPWDHLAPFDGTAARQAIHLHRDLVLRGHRHESEAFRVLSPDPARACLELAAGCVYDGSRYPNAFQWIELYADPPVGAAPGRDAPKRVRVHFRAWVQGAWQTDRNQPGCPDGHAEFDLDRPAAAPGKRPPPPADPRKYLEDLATDTGSIDIRGLVTGRPEAHRFPIAELYIELQATGTGAAAADQTGADRTHPRATLLREALVNPRLVIVGDPGCGKTTFLRWVAHCLAADRLGRDPGAAARRLGLAPGAAGPRLPLLIPIADWLDYIERTKAQKTGPTLPNGAAWLPAYLSARAGDANQALGADDFRRLLDEGQALILLDGLDEAPDRLQRERAVRRIERLAQAWPRCPLVVTSRPAAYQDRAVLAGFAHTTIEALDAAAIDGFLARWGRALFPERPDRAAAHHRELAAALASRREIRQLARNTVMLTALAVVHWNDKRLPEQRAELYESIVRWLIEAREQRPGRERSQRCRQLLADLALAMQTDPKGRQVQVTRRWAAERIAPRCDRGQAGDTAGDPIERAESFLAAEEIDSGILVRRGHQLRFWHLTFQEYLAAQALAGRPNAERAELLLGAAGEDGAALYRPEWRETVLLLAGVLYLQGEDKVECLIAGVLDRLGPTPTLARQARAAGLLGALVRDLSPFGYRPANPRYARVLDAALAVFDPAQAPTIPLADRIAAADALAQAGDPRLGWTQPGRWVELPGGSFTMGAQNQDQAAPGYDPEARDLEYPVHVVNVTAFRIARFPAAVQEFAEFLDDEDHADPRWWRAGGAGQHPEPDDWQSQRAYPSRPVVNLSWYQAMAFCAWLTVKLARPQGAKGTVWLPPGLVVRLPTEAEWEYAARGESGRRHPWGDEPPDAQRANYIDTRIGHAIPVGILTGDCTPNGVLDLAGNVWEWCLDAYSADFYGWCQRQGPLADPLARGDGDSPRVLRGGAFEYRARYLRSTDRGWVGPVNRDRFIGFRCVLAAPRQP